MKKKKNLKKDYRPVVTAKKHWIVYIFPTLFVIAGLILLNGEQPFKLAGLAVTLFGFYQILSKASEKWHLTDQHLIIEKGILPGLKKQHEISVQDIYKTHSNKTKLSKYFGDLGHITTRRRSDDCTGLNHSNIANPELFSRELQLRVQKLPSHNLNQVYELKEKGAISEKEYNLIKLGYVTQQHLSKL